MDPHTFAPAIDTGQGDDRDTTRPADTALTLDTTNASYASRQLSVAAADDSHSPLSSAPPTPRMRTPLNRRTSQPPASPIGASHSPRLPNAPLRRPSSSASLNRQPASPQLMRKSSRSSLGGAMDETERRPTPKRSISNLISGLREAQATMESIEEPIPLTAPQIATEHFTRELIGHSRPDLQSDTIVIFHDACYGHRYSRLKSTKTTLSLIVERPERIHACILGASTAYVRLGGHHAGGSQAPHPDRQDVSYPPFKMRRSGRVLDITSSYVTNVHGTAWMSELKTMCQSAPEKLVAGVKELSRTSTPGQPEKQKLHEGDLYLASESLNAFQGALGGVADAVDAVFAPETTTSRAFVAVRPPGHHCSTDLPGGFCWLNNVHVGIEYAAQTHGLTHAAILDFDLHHGDGSQAITWERNRTNNAKRLSAKPNSKLKLGPDIGYYSIHDINSYPCEMGDDEKVQAASLCIDNAHGQSIWNVHLQTWKNQPEFWKLYEERYSILLDKARSFLEYHDARIKAEGKVLPKSAIFLSAGFDASEWEGGGMQRHQANVPTEFYARFTQDVLKLAQHTESCKGRVISVLEGGYSDRALCSGVLSHLSGLCASPVTAETNGIGSIMGQMTGLSINGSGGKLGLQYQTSWWSDANLTALENKVNPPPPAQGKKVRTGPQPTYATPTESFAYKVVDPHKFARSVSGTMREGQVPVRPPTPPPPEVDWVVATQELSQLLIPSDRQTKSCTPEDLAVARPKKERQSATPVLSAEQAGQPRQLRDRRTKGLVYPESAHSDETDSVRAASRTESRSSRRETIDVLPFEASAPPKRMGRRSSAGSALTTTSSADISADAPPVPTIPAAKAAASVASGAIKPPAIPGSKPQVSNTKVRAVPKPRNPAVVTATANGTNGTAQTAAVTAASGSTSSTGPPAKAHDMEALTSGMKKVTLKVSASKEEHDRKQKEKLDAERRARALKGAETRRINAAAKKAAKESVTPAPSSKPGATTQTSGIVAPVTQSSMATPAPAIPNQDAMIFDEMEVPPTAKTFRFPPGIAVEMEVPEARPQMTSKMGVPPTVKTSTFPPGIAVEMEVPEHNNSGRSESGSSASRMEVDQYRTTVSSPEMGVPSGAASTAPSSSPGLQIEVPPSPSGPWGQQPNGQSTQGRDLQITGHEQVTASPMRSKLPVWSSSGPIPFATGPQQEKGDAKNVWVVPDTPAK